MMNRREIGLSGIEASVIGLGTWAMGGWMWGGSDQAAAVEAIQSAIDSGVNLIDTAPAYGLGLSEELVGKGIAGRRDNVVLATKCGLVWHTRQGTHFIEQLGRPVHRYLGPDSIRHELEESLRRLNTDYIDLYQTHWQDSTTALEDTIGELERLKTEGKIRAIGASNVNAAELKTYMASGSLDSIQEKYSMIDRGLEEELLPLCRENSVSVLAYSPLANGLLTGKMNPGRKFSGDDLRIGNLRFSDENLARTGELLAPFEPIAENHGVTVAQVVIAWTIAQPGVTFALCGARDAKQAQENARAGALDLSEEELAVIEKTLKSLGPTIS
jgi:methylglyoxal reductase